MISTDNLKLVLHKLNFIQETEQIFSKKYSNDKIQIKVNFDTKKIIYPKEIIKGDETTCNFSHPENFVVLECVNRLLDKGYKAEHIQLEPRYRLGHDSKSSGKADILVKNQTGEKTYIFIECKTFGSEFNKEWNNMKNDGGQLFSYFQQDKNAKFLCLYTSNFDEQNSEIDYKNQVINVNKANYKIANNVSELFNIWKNFYKYESSAGIFEKDINAYAVAEKALNFENLKELEEAGKYNEFAKILRKYNVSGKENAFDKLVNLFLCKIYDENYNKESLQFNYRGVSSDTYESLQDRLMILYKNAMQKFLNEEITYVSDEEINKQFTDFEQQNIATTTLKENIYDFLRKLKFYSHSDFSFLEVHNEKLFRQNGKILVEVVELFQNYKLTQNKTTQILGNLFELFLQKGMKQDEGQFFTPLQICEFVIYALPLAEMLAENPNLKVIDYACGAGHFLNTYANIAKQICPENSSQIYGIEKEYRLSKVAKVSSAMYDHKINFIYADALDSNKFTENNFDLLIANPPYSVKGFLTTLDEKVRQNYELYNFANTETNSIECFFIELANKILANNAYAAIILPSSVLNKDGIYEKTREIILNNFNVIAINELPSGTFGATGTNTIILFLHKKITYANGANSQRYANLQDNIKNPNAVSFANNIYLKDFLDKYCNFMNYELNSFAAFIDNNNNSQISQTLLNNEVFAEYKIAFDKSTEYKNLQKSANYKKNSNNEKIQTELKHKAFIEYAKNIEIQKFLCYSQIYYQQTLIIKAPSDNKSIKKFLGYEWSNAKGNEGIHELNSPYCSPLYERENIENRNKIAYLIRQRFLNQNAENIEISPELSEFVSLVPLIACIDFKSANFNKAINLSLASASNTNITSPFENAKFELVKLSKYCDLNKFKNQITAEEIQQMNLGKGNVKLLPSSKNYDWLTDETTAGKFVYEDEVIALGVARYANIKKHKGKFVSSNNKLITIKEIAKNQILFDYVYAILEIHNKLLYKKGSQYPQFDNNKYENFKIPLPPLEVQQQIVAEYQNVEKQILQITQQIQTQKSLINTVLAKCKIVNAEFQNNENLQNLDLPDLPEPKNFGLISWKNVKLGNIADVQSGGTPSRTNKEFWNGNINWLKSEVCQNCYVYENQVTEKITELGLAKSAAKMFKKNSVLVALVGATIGKVGFLTFDSTTNQNIASLYPLDLKELNSKFLYFAMFGLYPQFKARGDFSMANLTFIRNLQIPLPPIEAQEKIVQAINNIEQNINNLQTNLENLKLQQNQILQKYLF